MDNYDFIDEPNINQNEKNEIIEMMVKLYNKKKEEMDKEKSHEEIQDVIYKKDLILIKPSEKPGIAEQDVYSVRTINEKQKQLITIYDKNMQIATVDDKGNIKLTKEYEDLLKKTPIFKETINNIGTQKFNFPEEIDEEDIALSKEELEDKNKENLKKNEKENNTPTNINKEQEPKNENENDKDEVKERIAEDLGMNISDITIKVKMNPNEKITETKSLNDLITNPSKGKYDVVYQVSAIGGKSLGENMFVGIRKDENGKLKTEPIDALKHKNVSNTQRNMYAIQSNGNDDLDQEVSEERVDEVFSIAGTNEVLAVKAGDITSNQPPKVFYGKQASMNRNGKEPKYVVKAIGTNYEREHSIDAQRAMDDKHTSQREFNNMSERIEEQVGRNGEEGENHSGKTGIELVDKNKNNDKIEVSKYDEEITKHDGEITTIREESEKYEMSVDRYSKLLEDESGCLSERIDAVNARLDVQKEKEEEHNQRLERGERTNNNIQ